MLRARFIVSILFSVLFIVSAYAQVGPEEAVIKKLESTIVDAEYAAVDFEKIIDDFREDHDLNIQVSWRRIEALGVRRDDRLEIKLKQVSLATLLSNILREASKPESGELGYQIENGVIQISTIDYLSRSTIMRGYNVIDILESGYSDRRFFSTPVLSLALTGNESLGGEKIKDRSRPGGGGTGGGGGGGGSIYNAADYEAERPYVARWELVDELIDMIISSVTPDDWEDNGGLTASIRYYNSILYIRHTMNGHTEVRDFLELLRSLRPKPVDSDACIFRLRTDQANKLRKMLGSSFPRIPRDKLSDFYANTKEEDVLFRASSSGVNGQRIWFSAISQRDLLLEMSPVVSENQNGFATKTGFATEGLELIALPMLSPDGITLKLDIQMAWIPKAEVTKREVLLASEAGEASIDQLSRSMRTVSTEVELEIGDAIILSIPTQLEDVGAAPEWEDWLVLQVRKPGS